MKKGLNITLALIAITFLSVTAAMAFAPVIGDFPDIYVGDAEDNVGLTIDQNLFIYPDAFDFRDYVMDWDDPTTTILWSFVLPDPGAIVFINGQLPINRGPPPAGTPINPHPSRQLTKGGNLFPAKYQVNPWLGKPPP